MHDHHSIWEATHFICILVGLLTGLFSAAFTSLVWRSHKKELASDAKHANRSWRDFWHFQKDRIEIAWKEYTLLIFFILGFFGIGISMRIFWMNGSLSEDWPFVVAGFLFGFVPSVILRWLAIHKKIVIHKKDVSNKNQLDLTFDKLLRLDS